MSSDGDGGFAGFRHLSAENRSTSGSGFRCLGRGFQGNNDVEPWFLRQSASQTFTDSNSWEEKDTLRPPSKTLWGRSSSSAIKTTRRHAFVSFNELKGSRPQVRNVKISFRSSHNEGWRQSAWRIDRISGGSMDE
jgi:hypothetical protein